MLENDENIDVYIRIATIEDINDLSFLGKKTFDQSFGHLFKDRKDVIDYLEETFSVEKLKKSISKPQNIYWIVFYKTTAIGYAKIQLNAPSKYIEATEVCKLQKLYVLHGYVSKGIGGQLLQLIFNTVITNHCQYIWLSVLKSNKKGIRFYTRSNFDIIGDHPFRIGKEDFDFWVMGKKL